VAVRYDAFAILERLNTEIGDSVQLEAQILFLLIPCGLKTTKHLMLMVRASRKQEKCNRSIGDM